MINDWLKEFEDRFVRVDHGPDGDDHDCEPNTWNDMFPDDYADQIDAIKDFITSLLSSQRSSLITKLQGEYMPIRCGHTDEEECSSRGYNEGLAKVIEIIKQ